MTALPRRAPVPHTAAENRSGMTLVEVLAAVVILGTVLVGMMEGLGQSFRAFALARRVQTLQTVLSLGELAHPKAVIDDPVEDLAVDPDGTLMDGYTFERECLEDDDEDGLYEVHTRVACGAGGPGAEINVTEVVYYAE